MLGILTVVLTVPPLSTILDSLRYRTGLRTHPRPTLGPQTTEDGMGRRIQLTTILLPF